MTHTKVGFIMVEAPIALYWLAQFLRQLIQQPSKVHAPPFPLSVQSFECHCGYSCGDLDARGFDGRAAHFGRGGVRDGWSNYDSYYITEMEVAP